MAARFWVGGTGNWDNADTTHWSATSGGSSGASVPTSSDDVTFDSNSGTSATVSIITATANANTITINKSDLTLLHSTFGSTVVGAVTLTTGTLNTNGKTCSWGSLSSSNSNTRTLTLGASSITITAGAFSDVWNTQTTTGLTFSGASSTITFTGANAQMNHGALTFGTIVFNGGGQENISNAGLLTCSNITFTGAAQKTESVQLAGNITVSGTLTINGNSAINRILVRPPIANAGSSRTLTAATVSVTNADFQDITGAGAGSWNLAAITGNSGDCGGNSGITFTTPATQTWSGTTGGNWSANAWTTRVPLSQDDVVINAAFSGGQTVTADMPRMGKSISFSGASGNPTLSINSASNSIFGSLTLISGMTLTGTQTITFRGRSSYTITSAGKQFNASMNITAPSGTYTLSDDMSITGDWNLTNGTFDANGFNVTARTFTSSNSNTRTLTLGTGTWSTTATASTTLWSTATTTGLTFNGTSATIAITGATSNTRFFNGGGLTFGTLTYTTAGSTGTLQILGSNTFTNINFSDITNARTLQFVNGTTTTITGIFNVNGSAGKLVTLNSSSSGSSFTLTKTSGTVSCDYLSIQDSTATGGAAWYAGANSTNVSNNTGWRFTAFGGFGGGSGSNGIQAIKSLQNLRNLM